MYNKRIKTKSSYSFKDRGTDRQTGNQFRGTDRQTWYGQTDGIDFGMCSPRPIK